MKDIFGTLNAIGEKVQAAFRANYRGITPGNLVGMGADGTATHFLDKVCEDSIIGGVDEMKLPLNIVSEEAGFIDRGYSMNLVIDPLDGTFNAVHGIPFYSVSMAIMEDDFSSLSAGYIRNIYTGDVYFAVKDGGAFFNGERIRVSDSHVGCWISKAGRCADGISRRIMNQRGKHRRFGCASLEMCLVASGSADLMAYAGTGNYIRNIDIAAGTIIVREAGGIVTDDKGNELNLGLDVSKRSHVIAARSREPLEMIL